MPTSLKSSIVLIKENADQTLSLGSVIASRLSNAFSRLSVLVIEAGPGSHPSVEHPLGHSPGVGIEWDQETVPQAAAGGKSISAMCGKVSGGSSAINYQAWTRGPAVDL
jgi:choline dehydrogenase-like flavoprotein